MICIHAPAWQTTWTLETATDLLFPLAGIKSLVPLLWHPLVMYVLPSRRIKRSPLLLRTQTQVLMQSTPFVNNESISQGLRPVVHIANVVVLFYLSVWCLHVSYPQRFLTNIRRAHHLWSMSKVPILLVHNVVSCRWSSRLRLINRAYGLPRKPRL